MSKRSLKGIGKTFRTKASEHCPEILTGLGIAGMLTSTILAVRATPKALKVIEEEKKMLEKETLEPVETVKLTWRHYIPTVLVGGVSVVCLIWGSKVSIKRYTALAAACSLSETAFRDYRTKVVEKIGEQKEKEIHKEIAKERFESSPVSTHRIEGTGVGNELCFDVLSGRYFPCDATHLRSIENDINRRMREENYISANEYFYELGLDPIPLGEKVGWNIDKGYIDIDFDTQLTDDNRPCLVVRHNNPPQYSFR